MGIFNWLFGKKKTQKCEIEPQTKPETYNGTVLRINRRFFEADYLWEDLSTFRAEKGLVYLCKNRKADSSNGVIGEYKEISAGVWEVLFEGRIKIATVYEKYQMVVFTIEGLYNCKIEDLSKPSTQILADKLMENKPAIMTWEAIRWRGDENGLVLDFETIGEIGQFEGKGFEAAAAFALWAYDLGEDNKYSNFFVIRY